MEAPYDGPEVFLVADAIHDGFHFSLGTYFTDGSKLYPYPRRREVGWGFCSVTPDLQLCTGVNGPVTFESSILYQWRNSWQSFSWLKDQLDPFTSTRTASMFCAGTNKLTQSTKRRALVALWTRLHKALSRHQGTVEIPWCKAHITAGNFHQFGVTPKILVGNVVADALAKMIGESWTESLGRYSNAFMLPANLQPKLHRITPPLTLRMFLLAARRIRKRERTSLENASSHSLVSVARGPRCHVCELSTPARGALDWLRDTICSGPPNSRPDMPIRVGHQTLHESHQVSFHRGVS